MEFMKIMLQQLKSKQDNLCRGYCPVGYCPRTLGRAFDWRCVAAFVISWGGSLFCAILQLSYTTNSFCLTSCTIQLCCVLASWHPGYGNSSILCIWIRAWLIAQLPYCTDADGPDCENSWRWGRLWLSSIVCWNALSTEGVRKRANL